MMAIWKQRKKSDSEEWDQDNQSEMDLKKLKYFFKQT